MNTSEELKNLSRKEKIKLFNGNGSWKSYSANGKLPEIVMSDGPHGLRKQEVESYADMNKSNIATCFPTASCIASSWNKKSLQILGKAIALEALKENVQIMLGCGMNIKRSPLCGRNFEYFSEDPFLSGELAADYVEGMQTSGVGACIKHFACNNQEKRRQTSSSNIDKKTLHEIYLRGFEIAVKKSKPVSIMCSYNKINGIFAGQNKYLLTDVLRKKWDFDGIVISDWGACIDAVKCVKAGMDLSMPDSCGYFDGQLEKALKDGSLLEQELDVANQRVVTVAEKVQVWREKALNDLGVKNNQVSVSYDEQYNIALNLAQDSAVLLKNNDLLPLKVEKNPELLVIGELAEFMKFQAGGSSHITTKEYPNALKALESEGFKLDYEKGYYSGFCKRSKAQKKNEPYILPAVEKAKKAAMDNKPILLFCGLTESFEGEGFDRKDLSLPEEQQVLIQKICEISNKVVIVSFSGAPIDLSVTKNAGAILQMYLCGEACGAAVATLISGKKNPSGKLAETWPLKVEDTPCYENFGRDTDVINYKEGSLVGYRWYEAKNIPVQYPFGFGLSYTTFDYTDFSVQKHTSSDDDNSFFTATLKVKNTGSVGGSEIIQLYVQRTHKENKKECINENIKELRGFEKIYLNAGEEKTVEISLDTNAFKAFDVDSETFVTVQGNYSIFAGASIKDIKCEVCVKIEDGVTPEQVEKTDNPFIQEENTDFTKKVFTLTDSLGDMAKSSLRIRFLTKLLTIGVVLFSKEKSKEDPAVKIVISAVLENPLESLISTSGGIISYKLAKRFVKWAN
ncbi:MAG: glycoside hydrolase family 3 C-terminal domain-containing protein [Treponema sp.]|nr:glycoside hydrolase family 3 C-terminal domain-containing protein [Treponema sp.]